MCTQAPPHTHHLFKGGNTCGEVISNPPSKPSTYSIFTEHPQLSDLSWLWKDRRQQVWSNPWSRASGDLTILRGARTAGGRPIYLLPSLHVLHEGLSRNPDETSLVIHMWGTLRLGKPHPHQGHSPLQSISRTEPRFCSCKSPVLSCCTSGKPSPVRVHAQRLTSCLSHPFYPWENSASSGEPSGWMPSTNYLSHLVEGRILVFSCLAPSDSWQACSSRFMMGSAPAAPMSF